MALVVDASVAVKWVLQEPDSHLAEVLIRAEADLLVPDFWLGEATNVLWLQVRRKRLTPTEAREGLTLLRALLTPTPTAELNLHEVALQDRHGGQPFDLRHPVPGLRHRDGRAGRRGVGRTLRARHADPSRSGIGRHAHPARRLGTGGRRCVMAAGGRAGEGPSAPAWQSKSAAFVALTQGIRRPPSPAITIVLAPLNALPQFAETPLVSRQSLMRLGAFRSRRRQG